MKLFTNRYSLRIFAVLGMLLAMGVLTYLVFLPNQKVTIVYNESTFIGDEIVVQFPRWDTEKDAVSAFHIAPTTRGQKSGVGGKNTKKKTFHRTGARRKKRNVLSSCNH